MVITAILKIVRLSTVLRVQVPLPPQSTEILLDYYICGIMKLPLKVFGNNLKNQRFNTLKEQGGIETEDSRKGVFCFYGTIYYMDYKDLENRISELEEHNKKRWWIEYAIGACTGAIIVLFFR